MATLNSRTGAEALEAHSPPANTHGTSDIKGDDATGHLAIESARYLDAQQDIRTAHDAMCLADATEMMKISRDKIREDYRAIQAEKGREVAMSGDDDDTKIHVGNATYHVTETSQQATRTPVSAKSTIWPYVAVAAIAAGIPSAFFTGFLLTGAGQNTGPNIEFRSGGEDTDTWKTIRPYNERERHDSSVRPRSFRARGD